MLYWVHLNLTLIHFFKNETTKVNTCTISAIRGVQRIFLKIYFGVRYVWSNIVLPSTLKNLSSIFQMYLGAGSSWIICLKFEFLVVPLIFRACWWKAIERFILLLLVFKALSALKPIFWHPLSFSMLRHTF